MFPIDDETLIDKALIQNNKKDEATMTSNNGTLKEKINENNQNENEEECSEYPQVFVGKYF